VTSTDTPSHGANSTTAPRPGSWLDSTGMPASSAPRRARHRLPHLLLGVLLVVACVGGTVWWSTSTQHRIPMLALARPVTVGQVLTQADLRSIDVSASAGARLVPADQASSVVGRPMATSLGPGALLTPDAVGAAAIPAPGRAVVAVGVQPGQFPPALAAGTPVSVIVTAGTTAEAAATTATTQGPGTSWHATVIGVAAAGTDQTTVVSLELESTAASQLAQVPSGQLTLVMRPTGGGG
jgi:hypothetical protein